MRLRGKSSSRALVVTVVCVGAISGCDREGVGERLSAPATMVSATAPIQPGALAAGGLAGATATELRAVETPSGRTEVDSTPQPPVVEAKPSGRRLLTSAWHPLTLDFEGPVADEADESPNPFLDYRLEVVFKSPDGRTFNVPGFFDGDGEGGPKGNVWRARFSPSSVPSDVASEGPATWSFSATMRSGPGIAVAEDKRAGELIGIEPSDGEFDVSPRDPDAPGFLKFGRLEYVGDHYLQFADGPYWIKGGTDSPENFMGYAGFDNTVDQGGIVSGFTHRYPSHVADWRPGDPEFESAESGVDGKGIIGALNYLSSAGVNSIYFLPMNLGGDGQETFPFLGASGSAYDNTHYDVSKLAQWNTVFEHAQRQGIALHFVLSETETANERWLDNGALGVERILFYRELVARFGHLLAIKWNLGEENDSSPEMLRAQADVLLALDWAAHPIAVHTHPNRFDTYEALLGDSRFSATSIQYAPNRAEMHVTAWRRRSAEADHRWVLDMDENNPAGSGLTDSNADDLRKRVLYDVLFAGGNIEWYAGYHDLPLGGDMRLEDFRTREPMWRMMYTARRFMQDHLPFWRMSPDRDLLDKEPGALGGAPVLALRGEVYAIYLPEAGREARLDLTDTPAIPLRVRWFNPLTGAFSPTESTIIGGSETDLGAPPTRFDEDWIVLIERAAPVRWLPLTLTR